MVTVILPVLNGEKTIEMSIQSVLNQTYKDFELLIVDNGSTDRTVAICSEVCEKDSRVKLLHCDISGVVAGRNLGVANASGKYLAFIDADDEYKSSMLEKMVEALEKTNADIASCGYETVSQGAVTSQCIPDCTGIVDSKQYFEMLFQTGTLGFLWNKLYKASIWKDSEAPVGMEVCEDTFINCSLLRKERVITVIPESMYRYYENPVSVTRTITRKIDQDGNWKYLNSYKRIASLVEKDAQKRRCVERATWWVIKLGIEELQAAGELGIEAKKQLIREMRKTLFFVLCSKEPLKFKASYLKTLLMCKG